MKNKKANKNKAIKCKACETCGGSGREMEVIPSALGFKVFQCRKCDGTGYVEIQAELPIAKEMGPR
jgi:DnaJ-class molecular chaperone